MTSIDVGIDVVARSAGSARRPCSRRGRPRRRCRCRRRTAGAGVDGAGAGTGAVGTDRRDGGRRRATGRRSRRARLVLASSILWTMTLPQVVTSTGPPRMSCRAEENDSPDERERTLAKPKSRSRRWRRRGLLSEGDRSIDASPKARAAIVPPTIASVICAMLSSAAMAPVNVKGTHLPGSSEPSGASASHLKVCTSAGQPGVAGEVEGDQQVAVGAAGVGAQVRDRVLVELEVDVRVALGATVGAHEAEVEEDRVGGRDPRVDVGADEVVLAGGDGRALGLAREALRLVLLGGAPASPLSGLMASVRTVSESPSNCGVSPRSRPSRPCRPRAWSGRRRSRSPPTVPGFTGAASARGPNAGEEPRGATPSA